MALFQTVELVYYVFFFLVGVTICGINGVVLAHLREKGKTHYRVWLLPSIVGSVLGTLISLIVLGHFLLHIHSTLTFYYILWAGQGAGAIVSVYAAVRFWQFVNDAPLVAGPPPPSRITEAPAGVWPPPPKPPQ